MPIAVAHGEGRAEFAADDALDALVRERLLSLRFVDNDGRPAERYPANPNGSPRGHHRHHDAGRTRDVADAASGARVPHRAEFLAPGRVGRRQPVDADLPERASVGGLSYFQLPAAVFATSFTGLASRPDCVIATS